MKRLSAIFIAMFLPMFFIGEANATTMANRDHKNCGNSNIDDSIKANIDDLHERLQDCRFNQPAHSTGSLTRQSESHHSRRINDSAGNGQAAILHKQQEIAYPRLNLQEKAIAISRHKRGYYIYALRHIII